MSVIAIQVEARRVTRVFFDCSTAAADPTEQRHIERAIATSIALGGDDDEALESPLLAA